MSHPEPSDSASAAPDPKPRDTISAADQVFLARWRVQATRILGLIKGCLVIFFG